MKPDKIELQVKWGMVDTIISQTVSPSSMINYVSQLGKRAEKSVGWVIPQYRVQPNSIGKYQYQRITKLFTDTKVSR